MIRALLYDGALAVIVGTCVGAVLHPRVHTGIVGGVALALLAVFTVGGYEYEATNVRLGHALAGAAFCLWAVVGFWWRRAKMKRRLSQVVCDACPLHEDR